MVDQFLSSLHREKWLEHVFKGNAGSLGMTKRMRCFQIKFLHRICYRTRLVKVVILSLIGIVEPIGSEKVVP